MESRREALDELEKQLHWQDTLLGAAAAAVAKGPWRHGVAPDIPRGIHAIGVVLLHRPRYKGVRGQLLAAPLGCTYVLPVRSLPELQLDAPQ